MISDSLLTIFFPQSCDICGKSVEKFAAGKCCEDCWKATRIFSGSETLCHKCGAFLHNKPTDSKVYCRKCEDHAYDLARAAGIYEKAILTSVLKLKRTPFVPRKITEILLEAFNRSPFLDTTKIIPFPLSKQRFAERTFNQAEVLAKSFSENVGIEMDTLSVSRITQVAKRRAGMDRKARFASVENAFEVNRPKLIENQNILLIDDVFTSGATATNCAKALKKKGAGKVYVLTVARTI
jgi:competence protein ComFC